MPPMTDDLATDDLVTDDHVTDDLATDERTVVLAGVGGDAHSVGLIILNRVLVRAGYRVRYLGNQCPVPDICRAAQDADAVLVSNMDGHARYYLDDLAAVRAELGGAGALWYLGGNPSLSNTEEEAEELRGLGFDRVFLGFTDQSTTLTLLAGDLRGRPSRSGGSRRLAGPAGSAAGASAPGGRSGRGAGFRLPESGRPFDEIRDEVLMLWRTGAGARSLADNAEVLHRRTWLADRQREARQDGRILVQPRTGVSGDEGQRRLFRAMRAAGADVLSFQIDSLTRNGAHQEIELLEKGEQLRAGRPIALNGYPAVNRGVAAMRRMTEEFRDVPLQVRHSTRDSRLLAEVSFAAGVAGFEGGPITYNLPYFRDYPPAEAIELWRYVDRLAGIYHERHGVVIDREFFGVLTATLIPPSLAAVVNVLEALLAAAQGVVSVSLGYAEQGNRAQDIAAVRALRLLGREYLDRFGFGDVQVHTVFHQYMGAFPLDADKARQLLVGSARTARLSGAERVMVKSHMEAIRIPSEQDNADSVRLVVGAVDDADRLDEPAEVEFELALVLAESRALLDAALRLGHGSFEAAVVRAIEAGIIDVPFSPSRWNAGQVLSVRDLSGAVRFADHGALPLPAEVAAVHRDLVARRSGSGGTPLEQLIEADILDVARGAFADWPLDGRPSGERPSGGRPVGGRHPVAAGAARPAASVS